eukprot:scaffold57702_cov57-Phaeocystis_antarctica.AAC.3
MLDKAAPAREGRRALRHAGERLNHRAVVVVGQLARGGVGHHDRLVCGPLAALWLRAGEAVGHHEDPVARRHEGVRHQQLHLAPGAPRVLGRPRGDDAGARGGEGGQRRHVGPGRVLVGARPVDPPEDLEVGGEGDVGQFVTKNTRQPIPLEPVAVRDKRLGLGARGVVGVAEPLALAHRQLPLRRRPRQILAQVLAPVGPYPAVGVEEDHGLGLVEFVGAAAAHGLERVFLVALVRARDAAELGELAVRHHPHRFQPGIYDHLQPLQQALVGGRVRA